MLSREILSIFFAFITRLNISELKIPNYETRRSTIHTYHDDELFDRDRKFAFYKTDIRIS